MAKCQKGGNGKPCNQIDCKTCSPDTHVEYVVTGDPFASYNDPARKRLGLQGGDGNTSNSSADIFGIES